MIVSTNSGPGATSERSSRCLMYPCRGSWTSRHGDEAWQENASMCGCPFLGWQSPAANIVLLWAVHVYAYASVGANFCIFETVLQPLIPRAPCQLRLCPTSKLPTSHPTSPLSAASLPDLQATHERLVHEKCICAYAFASTGSPHIEPQTYSRNMSITYFAPCSCSHSVLLQDLSCKARVPTV